MGFQKGQAALDFLMTYGWAIALVVIIAAMLFAMGLFDVSNFVGSKAAGFSGVAVKGWKLDTAGQMSLKLTNQVGQPITINAVTVTVGTASANALGSPANVSVGADTSTLNTSATAFGTQAAGSGYTAKVTITYTDLNAGFNYTTSGTLTGKVS
jgi:hypothetical protein